MPKVTTSVVDLSTRVSATGTYNSAIVVAAKKGPIDTPTLVTSQTDFLERFTPNETLEIGLDTAMYEAYLYLAQQSNLYVVRSANTTDENDPALYGGCHIRTFKSDKDHAPIDDGFRDVEEHVYNGEGGIPDMSTKHYDTPEDVLDEANDAMIIYGSSQGAWNNDLAVTIITDPDKVKLEGAFIINVYKNKVLVETHTCSLDPSLKNGYGVNCYAETVLRSSNYIRADVSDDENVIKDTSYPLEVIGKYDFKNATVEFIKEIKVATGESTFDTYKITRKQAYNEGDIRWVNDENGGIAGAYGYYMCTTAGQTATNIPTFIANSTYKATVVDGDVVWTLKEIEKELAINTDYNAGEIVCKELTNKSYYYRVLNTGATGNEETEGFAKGEYFVKDGTIEFSLQEQTVETLNEIGYTYIEKPAGSTFNLDKYTVYVDQFLGAEQVRPETVKINNPLRSIDWTTGKVSVEPEIVAPTYKATYGIYDKESGTYEYDELTEHYCLPKESTSLVKLAGGSDGLAATNVENIRALKTLKNMNDYNIQLIMDGGNTTPEFQRAIDEVCTYREDSCKGIISTPYINEMNMHSDYTSSQEAIVGYRKKELNVNTRNLELYTTHQLIYDEFNDRNLYVSPSAFVAARIMAVAQEYGWHWAAAGYNRGVINSLDVAKSFDNSEIDTFSDAQVNTIIKEPGMGQVIFDELTLLAKASDLQDAHISRYIDIYLRPRIKNALKQFLFEFNDEQTRNLITKMLTTFMDPEVSARALYDYKIVCSEENNRPRDIQNNICNVWIFVQVMKLAKWIPVKLIVSPYGVSFDDLGYTG